MIHLKFARYRNSICHSIILTTDWQWLIKLAWGKRRVSSRATPGTNDYPSCVMASIGMWYDWWRKNRKRNFHYVVVTEEGADHGADYLSKLKQIADEKLRAEIKAVFTPERIAEITAQRADARLRRDFALADDLRKQMEEAGISVSDVKLSNEASR